MISKQQLVFFSKEARAPRDYKREYAQYHSKQEQIDRRSTRNKARRKLGLKKGDPREVDHKVPLSKGGGNGAGNLRAVSLTENRRKFTKTAAIPSPPIDNYTGRWTTVGSGRLGISTPGVSDVDYMVPVEDLESTEGFSPFQQYTSAYKKDFDMPGYRGGSIVALPEGPYKTIDDSYAAASKKYTPKQLRSMKESKDKIDFYRDIGVVLTDDAMKLHNKTANDNRERTYAEMRDAIRGFAAKQNIDPEKAMLVAGGAGYMHGMRDEVNDLDFFHDDLPDFVQEPYGRFDMDGGPGKDLPEAAKQYQMMHGMRVQTPESMLAFYQRLNRPKDQEKIKMLQAHLKTASTRHHLITGVPGAGKSTLAKRIAKEKGLPLFEIDSDPRFKRALQLIDEGKMSESNALQRQMFRDAVARKDPHVIEGAQVMLDPALARQHELQILDDSADVLAPRWAKREAGKHRDRALRSGLKPSKDEAYYDRLYRDTVYPRYQKQLKGLRSKNL